MKCDFFTTILTICAFLVVLPCNLVEFTDVSEDRAASLFRVGKQTRCAQKSLTSPFQFLFHFSSFPYYIRVKYFYIVFCSPTFLLRSQNSFCPHIPRVHTLTLFIKPTSHGTRLLSWWCKQQIPPETSVYSMKIQDVICQEKKDSFHGQFP